MLWSELICLGDLVKCLPDDLWHATGKKKVVVVRRISLTEGHIGSRSLTGRA